MEVTRGFFSSNEQIVAYKEKEIKALDTQIEALKLKITSADQKGTPLVPLGRDETSFEEEVTTPSMTTFNFLFSSLLPKTPGDELRDKIKYKEKLSAEVLRLKIENNIGDINKNRVELGLCYKLGKGVEKNYEEAFNLFRKAARQRDLNAKYELALCYQKGLGIEERDTTKAFNLFTEAAGGGNLKARNELAHCYQKGIGTDSIPTLALELFKEAADGDDVKAKYELALCYKMGKGVEQDSTKANGLFLELENSNDSLIAAHAKKQLGKSDEAVSLYQKAADKGDDEAQYELGDLCYQKGEFDKAVAWFQKAADQGNSAAQYALYGCYLNGEGVEENDQIAWKFCMNAAIGGYALAQRAMGYGYMTGKLKSVSYDDTQEMTIHWLTKAANQGDLDAKPRLDDLLKNRTT